MPNLYKLYLLLLLALFSACEKENNQTEISGKVIDADTNTPVADVELDLVVAEGIEIEQDFKNPVNYSGTSNSQGAYSFILPENALQILYVVTPRKTGYVPVKEPAYIAKQLRSGEKNLHDVSVAKGSYLNITVHKTADDTADRTIKLLISYNIGDSTPLKPYKIVSEQITVDSETETTAITRGYYYKQTDSVTLQWEVSTGDNTEKFTETIALKEYDTIDSKIDY